MPLKLYPPRPNNPNWTIRGTHLKVGVNTSSRTPDRRLAQQILNRIKKDIESGAITTETGPTFAGAALSYLQAGGQARYVGRLGEYFQDTPLSKINQAAVDKAAHVLYPDATSATRNRCVYTPISAILRHAGIKAGLNRPKGAKGKQRLHWLQEDQLFRIFDAADKIDPHFGALCVFLFYTGCRLSEALRLTWADVHLRDSSAFVGKTKNGLPRQVFLPETAVASLANISKPEGSVFLYGKGRNVYESLDEAFRLSKVPKPKGIAFHILRHSFGALMRRRGGLDTSGLVATGAWKSHEAARIYEHVEFSEEATKASLLPARTRGKSVGS